MSVLIYDGRTLLDNSAWAHLLLGHVRGKHLTAWRAAIDADEVVVCDPFRLEALYSARDRVEYEELLEELGALPQAPSDAHTWQLAQRAQGALAADRRVSHRVKIADLLVAASAHQHGLHVLHYDADYDLLQAHSGLTFRSVWIAPRGSL